MKKYSIYFRNLAIVITAFFISANSLAQTQLFYDNFNQNPVAPVGNSGDPVVDYTVWTTVTQPELGGGIALIEEYAPGDGMIKILARESTSQTGNRTEVSAPLDAYNAPFNPILDSNTGALTWEFTFKQNRNSGGGTSGFNGSNTGMAVVLASDLSMWDSQQGSLAKGYAITILKPGGDKYCVSLSRFDGGLSNYTVIAGNKLEHVFSDLKTWVTVAVSFHPATKEWQLFFRDENSQNIKGDILKSEGLSFIDSVVDETFTSLEMTHFGFALNTPAPGALGADGNAFWVDDYSVSLLDVDQRFTINSEVVGDGGLIKTAPDQVDYTGGSLVELSAVADSGYEFSGWGGDLTGNVNPLTLAINSHMNVSASFTILEQPPVVENLIHYDITFLKAVKTEISKGNSFFVSAYNTLITNANKELTKDANPVTNKTQIPPSGDIHDYLSLAPYWWPNPDTEDGLPWIHKDGEVNPLTRGDNTDQVRLSNFFDGLELLAFAYYFSDDIKYANKAIELINIWFVNSATKVNPNVDFGQGIPGLNDGRRFGIIEWTGFSKVITGLQIFEAKGVLPIDTKMAMREWINEFSTWMRTSAFGIEEGNTSNNHGSWYDYQVMGLLIYTGNTSDAKTIANTFKTKRIEAHIQPNGSQPHELARTKSVSYSTMNLRALTLVAQMAMQVGVDLWGYSSSDGRSIRKAYEFILPYVLGEEIWTWEQKGGVDDALNTIAKPLFSMGSTIIGEDLISQSEYAGNGLSYLDKLKYPPRERLFIGEEGKFYIFMNLDAQQGKVSNNPDQVNYEYGEDVIITAEPLPGFEFLNWTGDLTSEENPLIIKMDSTIRLTANFVPIYTVTVNANTVNGTIDMSPDKAFYQAGESISFTPNPSPGYSFGSWFADGGIGGNDIPLVITINRNIDLTAHFNLITYQLFVTANNGVVTRNPHSANYPAGTQVELTASASEGFQFSGWSGYVTSELNPLTITMDSVIYVTANFDQTSSLNRKTKSSLKVYPNPSQRIFTIETGGQPSTYVIYNLVGVPLKVGKGFGNFEIDMEGYAKGIYLLEIEIGNILFLERILLN